MVLFGAPFPFLASSLGSGITGSVVHVDKGYHSMAMPADVGGILEALGRGDT